ncbi:YrbL family protein [Pseudoxanthomonas sacheonensis]|uniref:YrbL family protein n=1 Tax=Pseudoxanthomonas sacheonensis TaxID=443615 RepID=UPI0013D6BA60|nr:YrbL family protein [Pseudoxanthomonas sacheonensis]
MLPRIHPDNDAEDWQGLQIISRGANRLCARDPGDPSHCLKFELHSSERTRVGARQRMRRWLAVRFPRFGENETELRAYGKLRARLGTGTNAYLAACHGLVDTPHGRALRCDCILLDDGTPAPSLYRCLFDEPRYPAAMLCAAVDAFEAWLVLHEVPLFDLNAGNFVVLPHGDQARLICIDTKSVLSGKEILPFSRWSRSLMRRKIERRAQRLRQRIRAALGEAQ